MNKAFVVLSVLAVLSSSSPAALTAPARVRVVATIMPLADFARAVAGDRAEVRTLVPPGTSVHVWQPRPSDVRDISDCDLVIYIGRGLEPWLKSFLAAEPPNGRKPLALEAGKGVELIAGDDDHGHEEGGTVHHDEHEAGDPHIWLDLGLDAGIVGRIAAALSALDPAGSAAYEANARVYIGRLNELDALFAKELSPCRGRTFVVAGHAAFGYLARRYGLVQKSLYGLSPDAQLSPKVMMEAVDFCRRNHVGAVFYENSVPDGAARTLAEETGARILVLKPGHGLSSRDLAGGLDFIDIMKENLASLKDGLNCH